MNSAIPSGFFAYSSNEPTLREPIREAVQQLNREGCIRLRTWEDCRIGGKLIVHEICKAIDDSTLFLADLTGLNANVMFELGFAIARDKRIWLVLDTSFERQLKMFEQLRVLTTVGYVSCSNSKDIISNFYRDNPQNETNKTIYRDVIEPNLHSKTSDSILYLKSKHDNEASIKISKMIDSNKCSVIVDDPRESTVRNITWYGEQVFNAAGVLCHLTSPDREGSRLQTAKYALVAGLAFGFGKNLLMLAEGDFLAPVDYRDLLRHYRNAREATEHFSTWLSPIEDVERQRREKRGDQIAVALLATELGGLRFGDYVAENESQMLVEKYFIPTAAYDDALRGAQTIFVGRKGSGKTANLLKLCQALGENRKNLICIIKPAAYEMQGIVELLRKYRQRDTKGYAIASMWKYLLYSEIARSTAERLESKPLWAQTESEKAYLKYVEDYSEIIRPDFSVRLERCVEGLLSTAASLVRRDIDSTRAAISEKLHSETLATLRKQLPIVLQPLDRVAILVDNLDKAWDKAADFDLLAEVLLGLLAISSDIPREFNRENSRRKPINVSLATFLRSDIFHKVRKLAREPDKIEYVRLEWDDRDVLRRVIEERFVASHDGDVSPDLLWSRYFCPEIQGKVTRDYILDVILRRPRDLIYFANVAVSTAVNRRHSRVEVEDISEAEKQYSLYALESVVVENTIQDIDIEAILFEFAGCNSVLTENEVISNVKSAGIPAVKVSDVLDVLCGLTFFGIQVEEDKFSFAEDPQRYRRDEVRARRLSERQGTERMYKIHPAFRAFLEIK